MLLDPQFMVDYIINLINNPRTLLQRFLGIYQMSMPSYNSGEPLYFFITINQIGPDLKNVKRLYDLKGSEDDQYTYVPAGCKESDEDGIYILKDQNFVSRKGVAKKLKINSTRKQRLI